MICRDDNLGEELGQLSSSTDGEQRGVPLERPASVTRFLPSIVLWMSAPAARDAEALSKAGSSRWSRENGSSPLPFLPRQ